jgi:hypothetical protein
MKHGRCQVGIYHGFHGDLNGDFMKMVVNGHEFMNKNEGLVITI